MAERGEADVALLQEAGSPPGDLAHLLPDRDDVFWNRHLYDRWCLVVGLSARVRLEPFRQIPPVFRTGERERTVWERMSALGLEFLGPQAPGGRSSAAPQPDVPADTGNVPTYYTNRQSPAEANRQLDYAFASRGFHEKVKVRALNEVEEWGASDHCRLLIEVGVG